MESRRLFFCRSFFSFDDHCISLYSRWWFHTFFMFIPTWGNYPLVFFRWVETLKPPTSIFLEELHKMMMCFGSHNPGKFWMLCSSVQWLSEPSSYFWWLFVQRIVRLQQTHCGDWPTLIMCQSFNQVHRDFCVSWDVRHLSNRGKWRVIVIDSNSNSNNYLYKLLIVCDFLMDIDFNRWDMHLIRL